MFSPPYPAIRHRLSARLITGLLLLLSLHLTGCVTSKKYKLAKDDTPPAKALNWSAPALAAELDLQTVIIIKGPGSWKREARWDEYVVQIINHGNRPLVVDSAQLIDVLGGPQLPGTDPWKLEKLSYTNWDKYGNAGLSVLAGAGVATLWTGVAYASAMGELMSGPTAAAAGGATLALTVIPIAAVVDIAAVAVINHQNKGKVQAEFDRRRIRLPQTIAPGQRAAGSLFFPMTPGPRRLVVKSRAGDEPVELVLELKPLAGLHLKPVAAR